MSQKHPERKLKNILLGVALVCTAIVIGTGWYFYNRIFAVNIHIADNAQTDYLYVPSGSNFEDLCAILREKDFLEDISSFQTACKLLGFERVNPGRYRIEKGMSNRDLIRDLKLGEQEPVKLTFNNIRLKENFAGYVGAKLEDDSLTFLELMRDDSFLSQYGVNTETVYTLFIPNTYEILWTTTPKEFMTRMYKEHEKFWNESRLNKAKVLEMTPTEVSVLASIVDQETASDAEMPTIAGVYLNRLKRDMKLEADPTVVFAVGNFGIRRVLNIHLSKDSKYNTYMYKGLPPGPICMPSIAAIDAVLNHQEHNYIYFCAKEDFSGRHNFASTLAQHQQNARKFQRALSQRKIYH